MNTNETISGLHAELEAERFMTDQISRLHEAPSLAEGIYHMLKAIGEFTTADRAYLFETSENQTSTNTYEWCAKGVIPQIQNLHDIPFDAMPHWISLFLRGENILIDNLEDYRESMPEEYELLKFQNITTLIAFPISVKEKLSGFIGVDNPDIKKSKLIRRLLSLLGKYVGTMIEDHKNEQLLLDIVASRSRLNYQLELDSILRGAQIGMWTIESEPGKPSCMRINATMKSLLGISDDLSPEEVYQFWYRRIPAKYKPEIHDYIQKILNEGYSEITYPWIHPQVHEVWVRCGGMLYKDYTGKGICIRGYHQDVTRNIENEQKYQNLTTATSQIYHAIYHINLVEDSIEKIAGANQKYTLTGTVTSAQEQLDDILEKLVAPSHRETLRPFFNLSTLSSRLKEKTFTCREYPSPSGIWRRATFIVQTRDNEGNATEILYVTQIIDDYKQKELAYQEELVKAVESANLANAAKSDFLSRMSHDIRTPLNGILGMLDIAIKNESDPVLLASCHQKMLNAATHLQALVNDVLDMQQMENDQFSLEQTSFDIREIFANCWSMLETQADQMQITLKKLNEGVFEYPYLIGSPLHIRQIFMNILTNAVKYNKPGGTISVQAEVIKKLHQTVIYKFTFADTGIGMSPDFLDHIFEAFVQEDTGARTTYKGTGLGMTIVHRLVQKMGGTIQVKSQQNVGTTFTLFLPFTIDEHQNTQIKTASASAPDDLSNLHVLVVEDNELNMEITLFSLEEAGLTVTAAHNGQEAVQIFEDSDPYTFDIILMDIMMPVMNGLDASKKIRSLDRPDAGTIPIIALSANAFAEDIQKSKNAGLNEHLAKPLEMDRVLKVITQYCH